MFTVLVLMVLFFTEVSSKILYFLLLNYTGVQLIIFAIASVIV